MKALKPKSIAIVVVAAVIEYALYLGFIENTGFRELITGACVAIISMVATLVFVSAGQVRFSFRMRDIFQAWHMVWYAIDGTFEVFHGLAKQLFTKAGAPSFLAAVPFDVGRKDSLIDSGRRAIAVTYTTATPNFVILGIIEEQKLLLYHQIIPGKVLVMTRKLGARS